MADSNDPISQEAREKIDSLSPGRRLSEYRGEKGVSVQDVAAFLGVAERTVYAIENEDPSRLPPAVFVKGYVKRYCEFLSVPATDIVSGFDAILSQHAPAQSDIDAPKKPPVSRPFISRRSHLSSADTYRQGRGGGFVKKFLLLLVIAGCCYAGFRGLQYIPSMLPDGLVDKLPFLQSESSESVKPVDSTAVDQVTTPLDMSSFGDGSVPSIDDEVNGEIDAAATSASTGGVSGSSSIESQRDSSSPPVDDPPVIKTLKITVLQKSWLEVSDGTGKLLLAGLKKPNDMLEFSGELPFKVVMGYAPGIKLHLDDREVPITKISRDNTATMMVGK